MTRHMKIDRLSTNRLNGTSNVPLLIQVQYVKSPEALPKKSASVQTKEAQTTPGPMITVKTRGRRQKHRAKQQEPRRVELRAADVHGAHFSDGGRFPPMPAAGRSPSAGPPSGSSIRFRLR